MTWPSCVVKDLSTAATGQIVVLQLSSQAAPEDENPYVARCRKWQQQQVAKLRVDSVTPNQENMFHHIFTLNSDGTARGRPPSATEITQSQKLMGSEGALGQPAHLCCFITPMVLQTKKAHWN